MVHVNSSESKIYRCVQGAVVPYLVLCCSVVVLVVGGCTNQPTNPKEPNSSWNYEAIDDWGKEYPECDGLVQSPINIQTSETIKASLPPLGVTSASLEGTIVDNGHTLQVTITRGDQIVELLGTQYKLSQFHFHRQSEHAVDGVHAAMEAHFVHTAPDGTNAVIGVLLDVGDANPLLERALQQMPAVKNVGQSFEGSIQIQDLLPADLSYWTYTGSLTTPPCSQGLSWIVLKNRRTISTAQVTQFGQRFGHNARPLTKRNHRPVLE